MVVASMLVSGCGGGGGGDTSPPLVQTPAAVSSVAMSTSGASLVSQQTVQLTATARDASGNALSGRSATWQSSAVAVATVTSDGLVTAVAKGTATITVTIESRTATAAIVVADGAFIGAAGGTVVANNGLATLTIPAGALTATLPITVNPLTSPPSPNGLVTGTTYELGPEGTTFTKPVTLEFKYPTATTAADSAQYLYVIGRYTAGKWVPLPGSSVNWQTRTVTAQTSSFSQYSVEIGPFFSGITVTPVNPAVLYGQSQTFSAIAYDQQLNVLNVPIVWSGPTETGIAQSGVVTPTKPGGPFIVHATATQWIKCNPRPCNLGTWFGQAVTSDSVAFVRDGAAEFVVGLKPVDVVTVTPTSTSLSAGAKTTLTPILKEASGATLPLDFRTVTWSTSNGSVAVVAQTGEVTAVAPGVATITATSGGKAGSMQLTVTASLTPVASVLVSPTLPTIERGTTATFVAQGYDVSSNPLPGRDVVWSTSNASVATVSAAGVVSAIAIGSANIIATIGGVQGGTTATVINPIPLVVGTPSLGFDFSCLARTNSTVWCWGRGVNGVLGNGTTVTEQASPVQVAGSTGYTAVFAGADQACALNALGQALCWGLNNNGQLGDNSTTSKSSPSQVSGSRVFTKIAPGSLHTCALDASGGAWCWGPNSMLGDPGTNANSLVPHAVVGVPAFTQIAAGFSNTCAITAVGAAWCWGHATTGEAGLGGDLSDGGPIATPVVGGHAFTGISSQSGGHVCALTASGDVWCWGSNTYGQLGNGSTVSSSTPVQVSTSLKFKAIAIGGNFSCGIVTDGSAWCWGINGSLGTGSGFGQPQQVPTPVAVLGNRTYTEISAGGSHTCARAADGIWCWGTSGNGRLGNGVATNGVVQFLAPVKVVFPQ